jgi:hypothetical protein
VYERRVLLIDPATAIVEAKKGLDRLHIEDNPDLASARAAGHAGEPVLVLRLDAPGQGYYLIPWQDERGIMLIVQVNAQNGMMTSASALSSPMQSLTIPPEDARRVVSDQLGVSVTGEPRLVWEACRESASPYQPLYQVPVADGDVFVSMDGSVHLNLTHFMKGGR